MGTLFTYALTQHVKLESFFLRKT